MKLYSYKDPNSHWAKYTLDNLRRKFPDSTYILVPGAAGRYAFRWIIQRGAPDGSVSFVRFR